MTAANPDRTLLLALAYLAVEQADAETSERVARLAEAAHPGFEHGIRGDTYKRIQRLRRSRRKPTP